MAAGGFRTFVAGETLDEDKINDFLMQGVLVFDDAAARDAAITSPVHGQVAFLKDTDETLFYDGTSWEPLGPGVVPIEYVIVGGGASAGVTTFIGGGGAGGYRSNVVGEKSGGDVDPEPPLFAVVPVTYKLTIGAGGSGTVGSDTFFAGFIANGGGSGTSSRIDRLKTRASGAGGGYQTIGPAPGAGLPGQGFNGGDGAPSNTASAGGGGAGQAGANNSGATGGKGGDGISSSITGTATFRGGGGGGAGNTTAGAGGNGGGGTGAAGGTPSVAGTANTGGGGGGGSSTANGANGGSGVVIFTAPTNVNVSFSGGVTHTTTTVGDNTAYIVTAAGPTDTVTIG